MLTVHGPVILDLNTQRDLVMPDGAYPMEQGGKLQDPLKRLFVWAARQHVPVVSTRLNNVLAPYRGNQKLVCVPGSAGYNKIQGTQLRRRTEMPLDCGTSLPVDGFKGSAQQFIFDLVSMNPFECPRLDRLLSESQVGVWLVCGGPLEYTIRMSVLGLLQRRHHVAVISDAIGMWDLYEGDMALRQVESKNVKWYTVEQAMAEFAPKPVRRPLVSAVAHAVMPRKDHKPAVAAAARTAHPAAGKAAAKPKLGKREYRLT